MTLLLLLLLAQQPATEDARRSKVMQWSAKADPAACEALGTALADASYDIRYRATTALYWKCDRAEAGGKFVRQLGSAVDRQIGEAGAILLLGYAPVDKAEAYLLRASQKRDYKVKLAGAGHPVAAALAVKVALARPRPGGSHAVALRAEFEKPGVDEALFLLAALRDIEDPECLRAAAKLLDDTRAAPGATSTGKRTVADIALEALVARFGLHPGFAVEPGKRYTEAQRAEVLTKLPR